MKKLIAMFISAAMLSSCGAAAPENIAAHDFPESVAIATVPEEPEQNQTVSTHVGDQPEQREDSEPSAVESEPPETMQSHAPAASLSSGK